MKKLIIAILALTLTLSLWTNTSNAAAKTKTRYTTQTVKLGEEEVKYNTKVTLIKAGKKTSIVEYKDNQYTVKTAYLHKKKAVNKYKGKSFKQIGRGRWNKCSWTWYSQRQLPGKGLKIPGRHVDPKRGFVLDKDGYICLGSGIRNKKKKVIVPTPFGRYGKVYDTNGRNNNKWFDTYVDW